MKLSIITINLNNKNGLSETISSVIAQTFTDYEYIIIDGQSTDGSLEVIKQNANHINQWISENDHGIYNAMNKGLNLAKGEYCLFLNSGDSLYDSDVLQVLYRRYHIWWYRIIFSHKEMVSIPTPQHFSFYFHQWLATSSGYIYQERIIKQTGWL